MATQLTAPIQTGPAIERILRALSEKRDRALQSRQLDIQERDVEARAAEAQTREQVEAFNRAAAIAATLPPGASPAEYPAVLPLFQKAFPEVKPEDFAAFSQIPWNRKTLQTVLNDEAMKKIEGLPEGDPVRQRAVNFLSFGQAMSDEQLGAQAKTDQLRGAQADIFLQGLRELKNNPEVVANATRASLGLDPTFEVPGIPGVKFDSNIAAQITAQLMASRDDYTLGLKKLEVDSRKIITDQVMEMGKQMGVAVGPAAAAGIVDAYNASAMGNFEQGQTPLDDLYNQSDAQTRQVIKAFIGAVDTGEDAWLRAQPESVRNFFKAGKSLSGFMEESAIPGQMENMVRQGMIPGVGFDWSAPGFGRGFTFGFEEQPAAPEGSALSEVQLRALSQDLKNGVSAEVLIAGAAKKGITLTPEMLQRARDMGGASVPSALPPAAKPVAPRPNDQPRGPVGRSRGAPRSDPDGDISADELGAAREMVSKLGTRAQKVQALRNAGFSAAEINSILRAP